jgi:TRAP-type C4-dicarboxylate transport system permease small subunit
MSTVPAPQAPDPVSVGGGVDPAAIDADVPRWLDRSARIALESAGWGYLALVVLVCADVVGRRVLGVSTAATTEIGGYLLAFGISWGLAGTLVDRSHIRIDVLIQRLPLGPRAVLHAFAMAMLLAVACFLVYGGTMLTVDSVALAATDLSPLRTPLSVPQGLWAVGFAGFALCALVLLASVVRAGLAGRTRQVDAICSPRSYQEEADETLEALANAPGAASRRSLDLADPAEPTSLTPPADPAVHRASGAAR